MFESTVGKPGCVLFKGTKSDLQCLWICLALKWTIIPETSKVIRKTNACAMMAVFFCSRRRCRYEQSREFGIRLALSSSSDEEASETSYFTDAISRMSCSRLWPIRGGEWEMENGLSSDRDFEDQNFRNEQKALF